MLLSGQVPGELGRALHEGELMMGRVGIDLWAGASRRTSILDAWRRDWNYRRMRWQHRAKCYRARQHVVAR